ncbi:MAG: DUF1206 domain-containing protein [Mycobacterium sp.]|nr:DUF1206 domain-containing protein [Mycobacterium sp.]
MSQGRVHDAVDQATSTHAFEYGARAGYATSALLHLLIAYIVIRLAFGTAGNADQSGALATLGSQTGGAVALWVAAVALFAMALWRLAEAVVGSHPNTPGEHDKGAEKQLNRVKSIALAAIYCGLGISAIRFASGAGQSSGQQNAGLSARLMQSGAGKAALVVAGLVILGVGCYHIYKGVSQKFLDDLNVHGGPMLTRIGTVGYIAKGAALGGAGMLVVIATLNADPAKAAGIDAAVKTLGQAPFGKFLLIAAAVGFAAYGAWCLALARYAKM